MEPENTNQEVAQTTQTSRLRQVTPLSKYLAMVLFIILPFVGGWIGYQHALQTSEPVVHLPPVPIQTEAEEVLPESESVPGVLSNEAREYNALSQGYELAAYSCENEFGLPSTCYRLLQNSDHEQQMVINDLRTAFHTDIGSRRYDIEPVYISADGAAAYFIVFIPHSSGCCGIAKFSVEEQQFTMRELAVDPAIGDAISPTGQFAAIHRSADRMDIVDIPGETVVDVISVEEGETLYATVCGYAGGRMDVAWHSEKELRYGVYSAAELSEEDLECDLQLVEYRTVVVE